MALSFSFTMPQVLAGIKSRTSRPFKPGVRQPYPKMPKTIRKIIPGRGKSAIGEVYVNSVKLIRLSDITQEEIWMEGFPFHNRERFISEYKSIYKKYKEVDAEEIFIWMIDFKLHKIYSNKNQNLTLDVFIK